MFRTITVSRAHCWTWLAIAVSSLISIYSTSCIQPDVPPFSLESAALGGEVKWLKQEISKNPALVHFKDVSGQGLLHQAAIGNHPEVVELLVSHGADVDMRDSSGNTALHLAAMVGNVKVAKALIRCGANCAERQRVGDPLAIGASVLDFAAQKGSLELVKILLSCGASATDRPRMIIQSSLHRACSFRPSSDEEVDPDNVGNRAVIALLAKGQDINLRDYFDFSTPLHFAAERGNIEGLRHLLTAYPTIDVNALDSRGNTPLHLVVSRSASINVDPQVAASIVRLLIQAGADETLSNYQRKTAYDLARENGILPVVKMLEPPANE